MLLKTFQITKRLCLQIPAQNTLEHMVSQDSGAARYHPEVVRRRRLIIHLWRHLRYTTSTWCLRPPPRSPLTHAHTLTTPIRFLLDIRRPVPASLAAQPATGDRSSQLSLSTLLVPFPVPRLLLVPLPPSSAPPSPHPSSCSPSSLPIVAPPVPPLPLPPRPFPSLCLCLPPRLPPSSSPFPPSFLSPPSSSSPPSLSRSALSLSVFPLPLPVPGLLVPLPPPSLPPSSSPPPSYPHCQSLIQVEQ
ncbi:hypothetical protein C8R44DRAFT_881653 [Mycena epipterygia]|nr:hypothetical protein C8R44DRAFT_881653 [Mycena epipterygia]